jgi:hypothetical protein
MSESYVQVDADGAGKKLRSIVRTVGSNSVHEQVIVDTDGAGNVIDPRQVTVAAALPAGANAIGKLAANDGVDIGDVSINNALMAGSNIIGKVGIDQTTPGTTNRVDIGAALPAGTNAIGKLAANSGVIIGDVNLVSSIPAGSAAIGKLAANSGVDIGDVDVTSIPYQMIRWGIPREPVWTDGAESTAPAAGTALVTVTVTAGKTGRVLGVHISSPEANEFRLLGGATVYKRFALGAAGTIFIEVKAPLKDSIAASTAVTIKNVVAGSAGKVYQASLLYDEV